MNVGPVIQTEKGPRLPITINTIVYDFTLPAEYPDLSPLARSTLANAHNIFELQRRQPSINELAHMVEMEPRTFVAACMEELRTAGWVRKRPSKSTSKDVWDWGMAIKRPSRPPFSALTTPTTMETGGRQKVLL